MEQPINIRRLLFPVSFTAIAILAGMFSVYISNFDLTWGIKAVVVVVIGLSMILALFINYEKAKGYLPYVLAALISKTGFAYAFGPERFTSANEVLTIVIILVWILRSFLLQKAFLPRAYFSRYVYFYFTLAVGGIGTALWYFHVSPTYIFFFFKSYTLYLFYLFLVPDCVRTEKELRRVIFFMLFVSAAPLYYATRGSLQIQNFGKDRLMVTEWGALNIFVGYMLPLFFVGFGVLLHKKMNRWPLLIAVYLALICYSLFLSETRTAWFVFPVGLALFILMTRIRTREKMLLMTLIIAFAAFFSLTRAGSNVGRIVSYRIAQETLIPDTSLSDRLEMWKMAWLTAKTYPLTGSGWGAWLSLNDNGSVSDILTEFLPRWHNGYLEILSQLGFPGLLAFLMLWGKILKVEGTRLLRLSKSDFPSINVGLFVAVVSCLLYACGEQQFFKIETASHTYFLAGLLIASGRILSGQRIGEYHVNRDTSQAYKNGNDCG